MTRRLALLPLFALFALAVAAGAQDTRPTLPPPESRPVPRTAAEAESRLAELRGFVAAEEPRVGADPESTAARLVLRAKEQAAALQKLVEARRALAEEAAEAAEIAGEREAARKRLEAVRKDAATTEELPDPRSPDAERRLKEARAALDARGKEASAAKERLTKELERNRALRGTLKNDLAAAEKELAAHRSDLEGEEGDARDYLAAGLDPEVVRLKLEAALLYRLLAAEAEARAARLKRLDDGLLEARIALLDAKLAAEDAALRATEAAGKELETRLSAAIEAQLERARSEAGEIDRLLAAAPDWARPYWSARRTLVGMRVELSRVARLRQTWEARLAPLGEIRDLERDADAESRALEDVDAGKVDLYEVVPQRIDELTEYIATHQAELDRARALFDETRAARAEVRGLSRGARQGGADVAAAAEARRAAVVPPGDLAGRPWYEREAVSDEKWGELSEAVRAAAEARAADVAALDQRLTEAAKILAETRSKRERNLLRYQSALRWTREGAEISWEAVERAVDDAKLAPDYVRRRVLGGAERFLAYWTVNAKKNDWSTLTKVGGALLAAVAFLILAAKLLPKIAHALEERRGVGKGAAFLLLLSAALLRRTVFTGLLAFCAVALPTVAGAPAADVALAAALLAPPFAFRTLRVLGDALLGREPSVPRPFKLNETFELVLHGTFRRLLQIAAALVPLALLLAAEGYAERNPGFVDLIWLLHALLSYAVVLVVALRPKHFLNVARDETGLRARIKTAVLVSYPVVVSAVIFLIVLRSLGYAVAVKYFLRQFVETAAWTLGAAWLLRRAMTYATRGAAPVEPPGDDLASDEAKWVAEGRVYLWDRVKRNAVRAGVVVPAAWFVLQTWGLTGAGYDAAFGRPIWGAGFGATAGGVVPPTAVTWANVVAAVVTTVVAFYGVRFVRDVLRYVLLPRTSLDVGLRYTIVTLVTYLLVAVSGVIVLGGQLKIDAAVIGGFAAALGVGLGFGLKEIVDNFFSGIILLVERPVKVGDVVAVGPTTGRVDRINMRSTTIMTAENKGLIVPNKDLISQQVTNWSAGTPTIRASIRIGIDYAADAQLFRKTALEVLDQFGLVLKTPGPEVVFRAFGASSLDFEIFYWIRLSTNGMRLQSDVLFALDAALKAQGIAIPFPRQDVVIHPSSELGVRRVSGGGPPSAAAGGAPYAGESSPLRRRSDERGAARHDSGVDAGD